jgi:RNA polymerase sigma factor for flagellar operon FliA
MTGARAKTDRIDRSAERVHLSTSARRARRASGPATVVPGVPAPRTAGSTPGATEDELVRRGLPLVQYLVSDVAGRVPRSVSREDLVSAGMLGLAQAARSWDPDRGVTFECFARTRINGAILDELRGRDWASRSVRAEGRHLQAVVEELTKALGRTPTTAEVAQRMGVRAEDVVRLNDDIHRATVLYYDSVFTDTDGTGALEARDETPTEALLARELKGYLSDAIVALPERLRKVVVEYFFEERPMQDIADELGVTESRISQMRAEALLLLKDGINSQLEPESVEDLGVTHGRVGKRKAAYYAAIASASDLRSRLDRDAPAVPDRVRALSA